MRLLITMVALLLLASGTTQAQTFKEWFRQKKTQREYLLKQIALLQLHLGQLKKGYEAMQGGLRTVHDLKNGEFNLHGAFFNSLKKVNPKVQKYERVAAIIANQLHSAQVCRDIMARARKSNLFSPDELNLFVQLTTDFTIEVMNTLQDLQLVLKDGGLELRDDERLQRIDKLYEQSEQTRLTTLSLYDDIVQVQFSRMQEKAENYGMRQLYNLQ